MLFLVLVFSISFLVPLFFFSSCVAADTTGWCQQDTGTGAGFTGVSVVDADTVWAGGALGDKAVLARSIDGGNTWGQSVLEADAASAFIGVSGASADTAWAVGSRSPAAYYFEGIVAGTHDGGTTLSLQAATWRGSLNSVCAVDSQTAWMAGAAYASALIAKTTDGVTWNSSYSEIGPLFLGISAVDANTVWAVGADGRILKTADGANWAQQDSPTTNRLLGVSAVDPDTAWAVGGGGVIIHTTDGVTWGQQDSGVTVNLAGVSAVSTSTAWAVGRGGTILKTVDGGSTWTPQASGVTTNLNGVSAVDSNTAWAVGAVGVLLHTTNGGVEPPTITSITPTFGAESTMVDVTNLAGTGFQAGATVRIEKAGTTVNATDVTVVSATKITCRLNLTGAPLGKYDVIVRNPDAQEVKLTQGFSVTNVCGGGAAMSLSVFGIMMGLLSLAGSAGLRRRFRRRKK